MTPPEPLHTKDIAHGGKDPAKPNGYEITKWAESCKVGSPTRKLILLLLALKCNPKSKHPGYCYAKHQTIADTAGCKRETVHRYIRELVADGFLAERAQRGPGGRRINSEYLVLFRDGLSWPDNPERRDDRSRQEVTTHHTGRDERSRPDVTTDHIRDVTTDHSKRTLNKEPIQEPKKERAPARADLSLSGKEPQTTTAVADLDLAAELDAYLTDHEQETKQRTSTTERRSVAALFNDARSDGFSLDDLKAATRAAWADDWRRAQGPGHTSAESVLKGVGKLLNAAPPSTGTPGLDEMYGRRGLTPEQLAEEADLNSAARIRRWIEDECETGPGYTATTEELHRHCAEYDHCCVVKVGDDVRPWAPSLEYLSHLLPLAEADLTETHGIWAGIRLRTPAGALA